MYLNQSLPLRGQHHLTLIGNQYERDEATSLEINVDLWFTTDLDIDPGEETSSPDHGKI